MRVVTLAGGVGSRLSEETELRPKPMVEVGGRPILWHIMKHYTAGGCREFVIALGYRGDVTKEYFADAVSLGELELDALRASAADDRRLSAWLTGAIASRSIQPRPPIKLRPDRLGFDGETLHLDTAAFNVATVEDAVTLADHILGIGRSSIEYEDGLT